MTPPPPCRSAQLVTGSLPGHSGKDSDAISRAGGTYCGTYGADDITAGFSEFLGYYMPRKVIADVATMKAAGTVIKKLARWLIEKGYAEDDESTRELVGTTARDLPASQKLLDRLDDWLAENAPEDCGREVEGHFWIKRVEPGRMGERRATEPEGIAEIEPNGLAHEGDILLRHGRIEPQVSLERRDLFGGEAGVGW